MTLLSVLQMPKNPVLKFITFSVLFLIGGVGIFTIAQARTERNAKSFCNSVKIGSSIDGLLKAATDSGARVPTQGWNAGLGSSKMLMAKFTGIDPMYGFYCTINASNGVVISKDLSVLDP